MKGIKCLMTIDVVKMTGKEIAELRAKQLSERHLLKWLPEYCLTKDNKIDWTENYHQFTNGFSGDEVFYLLDILNKEQPLCEEINNSGLDFLKCDFSIIKSLPNVRDFDPMYLGPSDHLVFELNYESSYDDYSGGTEWDLDVYLIGYLDEEKQFAKIGLSECGEG